MNPVRDAILAVTISMLASFAFAFEAVSVGGVPSVAPGRVVDVVARITNPSGQSVLLQHALALPAGWAALFPPDVIAVAPGSQRSVLMSVIVPPGAAAGRYDLRWSFRDASGAPQVALLVAVLVERVDRVTLTLVDAPATPIWVDASLLYLVRNDGNVVHDLRIEATEGRRAALPVVPNRFRLAPGEARIVAVAFAVAATDPAARRVVRIRAVAADGPSVEAVIALDVVPISLDERAANRSLPGVVRVTSGAVFPSDGAPPAWQMAVAVHAAGPVDDAGDRHLSVQARTATPSAAGEVVVAWRAGDFTLDVGDRSVPLRLSALTGDGEGLGLHARWDAVGGAAVTIVAHPVDAGVRVGAQAAFGVTDRGRVTVQTAVDPFAARVSVAVASPRPAVASGTFTVDAEVAAYVPIGGGPPAYAVDARAGYRAASGYVDVAYRAWGEGFAGAGAGTRFDAAGRAAFTGVGGWGVRVRGDALIRSGVGDPGEPDDDSPQRRVGFGLDLVSAPLTASVTLAHTHDLGVIDRFAVGIALQEAVTGYRIRARYALDLPLGSGTRQERVTLQATLPFAGVRVTPTLAWFGERGRDRDIAQRFEVGAQGTITRGAFTVAPTLLWRHDLQAGRMLDVRVGARATWRIAPPWFAHANADVRVAAGERATGAFAVGVGYRTGGATIDVRGGVAWTAVGAVDGFVNVAVAYPIAFPLGARADVAAVEGGVRDAEGRPLVGVVTRIGSQAVVTDAAGRYRFPAVPVGVQRLTLDIPADRLALPATPRAIAVAAGVTRVEDFVVVAAAGIRGALRYLPPSAGAPAATLFGSGRPEVDAAAVAGVVLELVGAERRWRTVSDASGAFTFDPLPPGRYALTAITLPGPYLALQPETSIIDVVAGAWQAVTLAVVPLPRRVVIDEGDGVRVP